MNNKFKLFLISIFTPAILMIGLFLPPPFFASGFSDPDIERAGRITNLVDQLKRSYSKKAAETRLTSELETAPPDTAEVLTHSGYRSDTKEMSALLPSGSYEAEIKFSPVSGEVQMAPLQAIHGITTVEALETALSLNPEIKVQREQVESSRGVLEQASAKFDLQTGLTMEKSQTYTPQVEMLRPYYEDGKLKSQQTAYSLNYSKKTRAGDAYNISVSSTRNMDNTPPGLGIPARTNTGTVNFSITKPLLRGRGDKVNTVEEKYAYLTIDADYFDLLHTVSNVIYNTTAAYWDYAAAVRRLEILKGSGEKARLLMEDTQKLIDASEIPAVEIQSVMANLASKKVSIIQAEQAVYQARSRLGIQLGVKAEEIEGILLPASDFPPIDEEKVMELSKNSGRIKNMALENRNDNKAAGLRKQAAELYLVIARDGLKPQLDLQTGAGYTGLSEGREFEKYFNSLGRNVTGLNVNMRLNYAWPEGNRQARGYLRQQEASYRKADIQYNDVGRNIVSSVLTAISDLEKSYSSYCLVNESLELYEKAVENEKIKYKFGTSTLLDIINVEDRYTGALLDRVSSRASYAQALSKLRYETSTAYGFNDGNFFVDEKLISGFPEIGRTGE
ncbi:MAG: hypothetical protein A2008_08440 [Candidatus Wallbacteria bacterium GWC2_49_35]|uniref:Outer membrane efflux protein n=1 Tax=Candidatus Wallbacteria bacterium GWC2_49_35 TaxID=1817813 RepID=A0A1F7WLG9_9BACT|nr:MAG: hypothetical protein A2008_08440 [Candidatus Wallbacteria bacterium GWC2_49_35]